MGTLFKILAALASLSAPALAQGPTPAVIPLHPGAGDEEGIVIPNGSPLRLASFPRDDSSVAIAKFSGRFELSGTYELEGSGEDTFVTIWPDRKSTESLPYWSFRGRPERIYLSNGEAFAEAVVAKADLAKLKADTLSVIRGRVTIVAEEYETSIECDVAHFSARFVSVVKSVELAATAGEHGEC